MSDFCNPTESDSVGESLPPPSAAAVPNLAQGWASFASNASARNSHRANLLQTGIAVDSPSLWFPAAPATTWQRFGSVAPAPTPHIPAASFPAKSLSENFPANSLPASNFPPSNVPAANLPAANLPTTKLEKKQTAKNPTNTPTSSPARSPTWRRRDIPKRNRQRLEAEANQSPAASQWIAANVSEIADLNRAFPSDTKFDNSPRAEQAKQWLNPTEQEPAQAEEAEQEQQQRVWRKWLFSRGGGLAASFLAHVLLVALLAFVTIQLPMPPANLALESSSTELSTESLEITEPIEVSTTETEPDAAPEAFEVAENFSDLDATISSPLGEMAAISSAKLPSSAMFAASSTGRGNALNAGSRFFGATAGGNCFCYLIDSSASMKNGPWEYANAELLKSLASLKEKQRFYIIYFDRETHAIPLPGEREPATHALYATPENLQHARRWIDTVRVGITGGPPNDALKLAIATEPDAIYMLTDGVTKVDVAQFLRTENRVSDLFTDDQVRVPIHTIAFFSLDGKDLLQKIAAENRGQFTYVPNPKPR